MNVRTNNLCSTKQFSLFLLFSIWLEYNGTAIKLQKVRSSHDIGFIEAFLKQMVETMSENINYFSLFIVTFLVKPRYLYPFSFHRKVIVL